MDINNVKAGEYQLVATRWDERTSKPGEPFTFTRHRKGDLVTLDETTARRLFAAGAVVEPGALEKAEAEAALQLAVAALQQLPDELRQQLTASVLGTGEDTEPDEETVAEVEILRQQLAEAQAQVAAAQQAAASSTEAEDGVTELDQLNEQDATDGERTTFATGGVLGGEQSTGRPPRAADKALWVQWAKDQGADPAWADASTTSKSELIARYGG